MPVLSDVRCPRCGSRMVWYCGDLACGRICPRCRFFELGWVKAAGASLRDIKKEALEILREYLLDEIHEMPE